MCGTRGTFFKDKRRGAVLILVLFVLTGLSVLTVEFSRDILLDHAMSTSTRSILAAKPLMESGERLATAVLTRNSEAGTPDHVREDWGLFGLGLERLSAELPGADLSGSIEDENSRFPINAIFYEREADRARAEAFAGCWPGSCACTVTRAGRTTPSRLPKSTWIRSVNGAGRRKRTKTP